MAAKTTKRPAGACSSATVPNSELFKELESSSDEVLALLDLFGRSLLDYRKLAQSEGYQVWGNSGLGILGDRATQRLHKAVEQLREPLRRNEARR